MTFDQAAGHVEAEIDARLAILRRRFEDSLIANDAPADQPDMLLEFNENYLRQMRDYMLASRLAAICAAQSGDG